MLEAIRRYDELQHISVLVRDDLGFRPTGQTPSRPEHEPDRQFLRELWRRVKHGKTPSVCEAELSVDSYRVRACIAYWLDEGSLKPV